MDTTCPNCHATLHLSLTAAPSAPSPALSDGSMVELVMSGTVRTVRDAATVTVRRTPTAAELEQARRQLNRLVADGLLRVRNTASPGGRPLGVYEVMSRPATG